MPRFRMTKVAVGSSASLTFAGSGIFIRMVASASIRVTPLPTPSSVPSWMKSGSAGSFFRRFAASFGDTVPEAALWQVRQVRPLPPNVSVSNRRWPALGRLVGARLAGRRADGSRDEQNTDCRGKGGFHVVLCFCTGSEHGATGAGIAPSLHRSVTSTLVTPDRADPARVVASRDAEVHVGEPLYRKNLSRPRETFEKPHRPGTLVRFIFAPAHAQPV